MKALYQWIGITRQGMHQGYRRYKDRETQVTQTLFLARGVRSQHPGMGCRDVYYACRSHMPRGRDWTERTLMEHGFGVSTPRSFTRSTGYSLADRIAGKTLTGPNQVWQTDITYVWAGNRWQYVSFVVDVYTRQIRSYQCTQSLSTEPQLELLTKALRGLDRNQRRGLIVHTDRGSQYGPRFTQWVQRRGMVHSMAHYAWQNAYCERFHRTIKKNYLKYYPTDTADDLRKSVAKAVNKYNKEKPHSGLPQRLAPDQFFRAFQARKYPNYTETIWCEQKNNNQMNRKKTSTYTRH